MFTNQDLKRLILPLLWSRYWLCPWECGYMMVSNAGEAATSGVSLVDMVNTLFINIFAAVATGGAVVSSQYLGQRRRDRACQSANQLILIIACISLIIMVLCILFRRGVLHLLYGRRGRGCDGQCLVYLTIFRTVLPLPGRV